MTNAKIMKPMKIRTAMTATATGVVFALIHVPGARSGAIRRRADRTSARPHTWSAAPPFRWTGAAHPRTIEGVGEQ
ncbi:hypothetical protein ACIGT4_16955 [Streptomyces sioyaensis]|uniref:hypothetical protein n=1 Tax=Streptomyces sioyaensis TaxID=67364 RepID=UPI0037D8326B